MSIPDAQDTLHVVHLTSAHPRYDIRIFRKQCRSLAKAGFRVSLVVADGLGDELTEDGIAIKDVGKMQGRINRIFRVTRRVLEKARELNADLYQIHDPELLPIGLTLLRSGKIVVFDSHEDVPKQIISKTYLNVVLKRIIAESFRIFEKIIVKKFNAIIVATPSIAEKFDRLHGRVVNINNFPILGELESKIEKPAVAPEVCYIGGISVARGILSLVEALTLCRHNVKLNLVGEFSEKEVEQAARELSGWSHVNFLGYQNREGVREVLGRSVAGLVTLAPLPNHIDSLPIKMFEYMAASIPVIASNFPLWREILENAECGVCVDPMRPEEIAAAIDGLMDDWKLAEQLGRNGKKAVDEIYNWQREEPKLVALYCDLLK